MESQIMLHSSRRLAICVCVFGGWKSGCQQHQVDQLHFIFLFLFFLNDQLAFSKLLHHCCSVSGEQCSELCKLQSCCRCLLSHLNETCNSVKPKTWEERQLGCLSPRSCRALRLCEKICIYLNTQHFWQPAQYISKSSKQHKWFGIHCHNWLEGF